MTIYMNSERLDVLVMLKTGFSRNYAQEAIKGGYVSAGGRVITKPGAKVEILAEITVAAEPPAYVSRGGRKLAAALAAFRVDVSGTRCLDIGASAGGFTDCLLQNGADSVTALDVGTGQLAERLLTDKRVISIENTHIKDFISEEPFDFICADLSFISLTKVMADIERLLKRDKTAVLLIKPQFEAGRGGVNKRGVVISEAARKRAVKQVKEAAASTGLIFWGIIESPITGGDGNTEYMAHFRKRGREG